MSEIKREKGSLKKTIFKKNKKTTTYTRGGKGKQLKSTHCFLSQQPQEDASCLGKKKKKTCKGQHV